MKPEGVVNCFGLGVPVIRFRGPRRVVL
jgi:hypothetical protein